MFLPKKKDTTHNVYMFAMNMFRCYGCMLLKNFNCLLRERFFLLLFYIQPWLLRFTFNILLLPSLSSTCISYIITFFFIYYFLFFNHKLSIFFCIYFFFFSSTCCPVQIQTRNYISLTLDNCHASITICTHMC